MKTMSLTKVCATTALMSVALSACGGAGGADVVRGDWQEVTAAAEEEGQVNLYSMGPPVQNNRLVEAFNEQYPGIQVVTTRGSTELNARVESEIRAGADGADVLINVHPDFYENIADNVLAIDGPNVEGWHEDSWALEGKAVFATKYPWTMFLWNTNIFPDGFQEWDDLLEEDVSGRVATRDKGSSDIAATVEFLETKVGADFLDRLAEQQPKFYDSAVPMAQAVASGEVGVTIISTPAIAMDLQEQGAPVDYSYPDPGFGLRWVAGALSTSQRPNAARLFVDFMMSPEGQVAINGDGFGSAGRDDIEGALDLSGWEFFDPSLYTAEKMQEMQAKFDEYFDR